MRNDRVENLKQLIARRARESLGLELKQWIGTDSVEHISKFIKGCFAMRNNNGGQILIGFDNATSAPLKPEPGFEPRLQFDADKLQKLISKYASEPFEVTVDFINIEGVDYPAITIPGGIKSPVIATSDLLGANAAGKNLIQDHAVYVRTVSSQRVVSSSTIQKGDWPRLLAICFENREADVARFVSRHLRDLFDVSLLQARVGTNQPLTNAKLLERFSRFQQLLKERGTVVDKRLGYREFAVTMIGTQHEQPVPDAGLRFRINASMPHITGNGPWADFSGAEGDDGRVDLVGGGYERLWDWYSKRNYFGNQLDYWWLNPNGQMYTLRGLEDDLAERIPKHVFLDFYLQITRMAEAIVVAASIAKTLGFDDESIMRFSARWKGLKGRQLTSWVKPERQFHSLQKAAEDEYSNTVDIPLNISKADLLPYIRPTIDHLFARFQVERLQDSVVDGIIQEGLRR